MKKTLVMFHQIGPYHHARLNAASKHQRICALEWSGKSLFDWGSAVSEARYEKHTAFPHAHFGTHSPVQLKTVLGEYLQKIRPDTVAVNGWFDFGSTATVQVCSQLGIPMVLMSESTERDFKRNWFKERVKSRIASMFDAALVGGTAHAQYLQKLGFNASKIFLGYDTVDNHHFGVLTQAQPKLPEGFVAGKYFLASARFVPKKNLELLLRAFASVCELTEDDDWRLVLLGDGPLRTHLENTVRELKMSERVFMPGFLKYDQLPCYYQSAFAFVHASSSEQWGLVVNEAMASGLPVIVSRNCGCAGDLVQVGLNGFTFDPSSVAELTDCMRRIISDSERRPEYGLASQQIIAQWGPDRFGLGLADAVSSTSSDQRTDNRFPFLDNALLQWMNRR